MKLAAVVFRFGENRSAPGPWHDMVENNLYKMFLSRFSTGRQQSVLSLPRLWSVLLGYEVPDVQPVLAGKGELRALLLQGGRGARRLAVCRVRLCLCASFTWACVCFCVYCQHVKWPQMGLYMHGRITENLISCRWLNYTGWKHC